MKIPSAHIQRIAILRALQLGDLLCAIPAIRALHNGYPQAEITLLGLPWAGSFMKRFPAYFHSFIHFPGYPGLPEQQFAAADVTAFMDKIQRMKFDLVLQMQGNGTIINPMVELLGGKYTAGFYQPGDYCPDPELFMIYPERIHEVERHLSLMHHLGIESHDTRLEFPLTEKDKEDFETLKFPFAPQTYFCVHPGSRSQWRRWPPAYFAALADHCAGNGFSIVITGNNDEWPVIEKVKSHLHADAFVAAENVSLGALAILIKNAAGLISNCTGPSHLAAAFETPSVIISMDGEAERWAPLNKSLHYSIDWTQNGSYDTVLTALEHLLTDIKRNQLRNNELSSLHHLPD